MPYPYKVDWPMSKDPDADKTEDEVANWLDELNIKYPYSWDWGKNFFEIAFRVESDATAFRLRFNI